MHPLFYLPLLLGVAFYAHGPDHFRHQWQLGVWVCLIPFLLEVKKRSDWTGALLLGWALYSATRVFAEPISQFGQFATKIDASSAYSFAALIVIVLGAMLIPSPKQMMRNLAFAALVNAVVILWQRAHGQVMASAMDNSALDGTFIALCFPLTIREALIYWRCHKSMPPLRKEVELVQMFWMGLWVLLPLLAVIACLATTPVLMISAGAGVFLTAYVWNRREKMGWPVVLVVLGAVAVFLQASGLYQGGFGHFIDDSGRYTQWDLFLKFFFEKANLWTGTGMGTFERLGPMIQHSSAEARRNGFFIWAHNDWLQILFEMGFIGLGLSALFLAKLSARSFPTPWKMATLASFAVAMLFQMPMHHFLTAFYGLLFVRVAMVKDEEEEEIPNREQLEKAVLADGIKRANKSRTRTK